ncbi:MAG TPA: matrixin family metalloprotease [Bryobacteraceae bacterium]|nr:matrixin family metalloprotease [Bryobacteraceae bacterium]
MTKRFWLRFVVLAVGSFLLTGTCSAYYYFVYFNTRTGPFNPIPAKFDLNALTNNEVPFFISGFGPSATAPGDSFQAIIAEIRGAADVWNGVGSSAIRLTYGGLFTPGTSQSAPGIDVEFSDNVPPGLLAMSGPESYSGTTAYGATGIFVPISRSKLMLPRDLSQVPAAFGAFPSYSEEFFTTLVHEFGHTLGLQHTQASGVMSTGLTSAASKAVPLGADDIAGISLLYPAGNYTDTVGSISGRVTMSGTGLNLASVVAISPSNPAISTLTNPDGTYQINGIPPGFYSVYVHALPSYGQSTPDGIDYPKDVTGAPRVVNYTAFATQFYNGKTGGTRDSQQAMSFTVTAGSIRPGVDFNVSQRDSIPVSSVRTYGYTSSAVYVTPPSLASGLQSLVAMTGTGLLQANNVITPGLTISPLGTAARVTQLSAYAPPQPYIAMYLVVNFTAGPGPKHLLFSTPSDVYVLPAAFTVVNNPAPSIASITPAFDASGAPALLISGTAFFPDAFTTTRIFFDGLPGVIEQVMPDGSLLVLPPQASPGYTAAVVALNSDGQSSLFLQPVPTTYSYAPGPAASLTVSPASLLPGGDIVVDVVGAGTNFVDGQTTVGFGTSDVVVRKVSVLSPGHLQALVTPNAFVSSTSGITVTTGLGVISQALGTQIVVANSADSTGTSRP